MVLTFKTLLDQASVVCLKSLGDLDAVDLSTLEMLKGSNASLKSSVSVMEEATSWRGESGNV